MQIEIKSVGQPYKDGKYTKMEIEYVADGKTSTRKLVSVGKTAAVVDVIKGAIPGELYDIELVKNGEFWNWEKATKAAATAAKETYKAKNTYETPEERARRQVYIVRQNALTNAVTNLGAKAPVSDVLKTAEQFAAWVFESLPDEEFPD